MQVDVEYEAAWAPFSTLPQPKLNTALELRHTNDAAIATIMTLFPHNEYADIIQTTLTYTSTDGTQQTMLRFDPAPPPRATPSWDRGAATTTSSGFTTLTTTSTTGMGIPIPTPAQATLTPPIPAPPKQASTPALLYLHGGGLVSGSPSLFRKDIIRYARATSLPVFAPAYRLAPEHPYPTPLDDVCAALSHLREHAAELGVDASRIAVLGASAGGGLAAGVVVRALKEAAAAGSRGAGAGADGETDTPPLPVARLVLLSPMLDDRTWLEDGHPLRRHLTWTQHMNVIAWTAYLGERAGDIAKAGSVPRDAAPARVDRVGGFPPTYLEVGGLDLLRDEVLAFGARLAAANVEVEMHLYPGVPHAWEWVAAEAGVTRRAMENRVGWLTGLWW